MRAALVSGDEKNLPPADALRVKAYIREYVDSRRSAGEFFIPVAVAVLVLGFFPALAQLLVYAWVIMLVGVVLDTGYLWYRLRKELPEAVPGRGAARRHPVRGDALDPDPPAPPAQAEDQGRWGAHRAEGPQAQVMSCRGDSAHRLRACSIDSWAAAA